MPRDRADVDDHAGALGLHPRDHRLGAEEQMLQVHADPVFPIFFRHFLDGVAIVIGGVVDQDVERAMILDQLGDLGLGAARYRSGRNARKTGGWAALDRLRPAPAIRVGDVEKGHVCALADKALDQPAPMPEPPPVISTRLPLRLG
jgi:hypothetical protein